MAEQLANIDALPEQFGSLATGFRSATAKIAWLSAQAIPSGVLPTNVFLRGAYLETRLFITRTGTQLLFGFIRRREETEVIMDVSVNFRFEISEREFVGVPISHEAVLHTAIVPPFFLAKVPEDEANDAAKILGADLKEIFFLQLDAGILGVVQPDDISRARVAWQAPPDKQWVRADESAGPSGTRRWKVPPFLALARTVGLWIKGGFESGEPTPVSLPAQAEPSSEKAALYLLRQLTSAWIQATNGVRNHTQPGGANGVAADALLPDYDTADFSSKVLLRLDSAGQLARKGDQEDLFLLQAALRINEDERRVARSRISIGPPDFLGGGALYDAFLDSLEEPEPALRMASQLGLKGQEFAIRSFIRSARSKSFDAPLVFRVKHGKHDTDVITLHGTLNTLLQHVVLRAEFDVEAGENPTVNLRSGTLDVLYTDRPREGSAEPHGNDLVSYFLRLLTNLRNWQKALK